jgi:hypothetical protein
LEGAKTKNVMKFLMKEKLRSRLHAGKEEIIEEQDVEAERLKFGKVEKTSHKHECYIDQLSYRKIFWDLFICILLLYICVALPYDIVFRKR